MPRKILKKPRIENKENVNSTFTTENQENNGVEFPTVLTIFRDCEDLHAHERLITQLKLDFYEKLSIDQFSEDFFNCFRFVLQIDDRTRSDIPLKFIVKFAISCLLKAENEEAKEKSLKFMRRLIKFVIWHHECQDPYVRFHVVKTIKILLTELTDDIEVPDALYEMIQEALLKRFWDIKTFIRSEAAQASSRLQNPSDAECTVVISLIHLCKFDGSHTVRLAAMNSLAITTKTLPVIITRCRDVNDLVRKKAFDLLIKWKILKPLTVSKRLQIMETGLNDKSEIVRHSCVDLLKVWLNLSNNDPVALLKRLDVETMEESTELTLKNLFQSLTEGERLMMVDYLCGKMDEKHLVLEEHINCEMAFFWRHLVQFLSEKSAENAAHLERIIPTVIDYVLYLQRLINKPIEQSRNNEVNLDEYVESYTIIKHLLPIVRHMDIFDEHNRKVMIDMIKLVLSSPAIPFNYVDPLMKLIVHLESNNEKICNITVELINELLFSEQDPTADPSISVSIDALVSHNEPMIIDQIKEPEIDPAVTNREAIRRNKLEIAEVDVRINELNESLNNCRENNVFDNIKFIVDDLKALTEKKKALLDQNELLVKPVLKEVVVEEPVIELDPFDGDSLQHSEHIKQESKDFVPWMRSGNENKIIKANVMTISMIQECNLLWVLSPSLRTLFENVILVSVQHSDLCVRQKAILSMGLCCLLDKDIAVKYYQIFIQSLRIDHDSIKEISLKSIIDMFVRFGIEPFQESLIASKEAKSVSKNEELNSTLKNESSMISQATRIPEEDYNKYTTELLSPVIELLDNPDSEIQTTVAIGISKLLYNHKLTSSKLLSRLLLLWFNPNTEENVKLRQYLAAFFTNFSLMTAENQESITNCFLITMRALFRAPANSPLLEIDFNNVIDFFERVTDSKYLVENRGENMDRTKLDNPCHDNLATIISNQILNSPLSVENKFYIPMLTRLRLSPNNAEILTTLTPQVKTMIKKIKDKKCVLMLEKLHKTLSKRLEEANAAIENAAGVPADDNDDVVNRTIVNETLRDVAETPRSAAPSLLEMGSDGKKLNETYLGRRAHRVANIADTVSQISSMNLDEDSNTTEKTEDEDMEKSTNSIDSSSVSFMSNIPQQSTNSTLDDDDTFRKPDPPRNVRVTRSNSRANETSSSVASSTSDRSMRSNSRANETLNESVASSTGDRSMRSNDRLNESLSSVASSTDMRLRNTKMRKKKM